MTVNKNFHVITAHSNPKLSFIKNTTDPSPPKRRKFPNQPSRNDDFFSQHSPHWSSLTDERSQSDRSNYSSHLQSTTTHSRNSQQREKRNHGRVQTQAKKPNPREIQKQADHWKEMYEKLESEHTKVIPKSISRMTSKDKQKLDINEMTRIQTTIRDSIWRKVKFITDNVQAQDICKKIWQYIKSQKRD